MIAEGLMVEKSRQPRALSTVRLPGSWLGAAEAISGAGHQTTGAALTDCAVRVIPTTEFLLMLAASAEVAEYVVDLLAREIADRRTWMGDCSTRLALLLHQLFEALSVPGPGGSKRLTVDVSVTQMAEGLGASRESISRLFSRLTRAGIVRRERGWLSAPAGSPLVADRRRPLGSANISG